MKKIWIAVICVLLIGGCVFMIYSVTAGRKYAKDELRSCRVSTGGGMRGGSEHLSLTKDQNGNALLSVSQRESHAAREITTTYRVSDEAFARIHEMVCSHDLYRASKRPYSKVEILDGDTTTLSFSYAGGSFSVSEEQVMNANMSKGFRDVIDYLASLAVGEGVTTKEPQKAVLYLKSGYTLQFIVADAFDGKLNAVLEKEHEVFPFEDCGIVLAEGEAPDVSGAKTVTEAEAGTIVFSGDNDRIILLYADAVFDTPVYPLAQLDANRPSACQLIAEMEGEYRLYLNE